MLVVVLFGGLGGGVIAVLIDGSRKKVWLRRKLSVTSTFILLMMRGLPSPFSPMPVTAPLAARSVVCRMSLAGSLLCASLAPLAPLASRADDGATQSLAEREIARRDSAVREASALMQKGHLARQNKDLAVAVDSYDQVVRLLPQAPATAALRAQALLAFAETSTARAEQLATQARYEDANRTLDAVLSQDRLPEFAPALRLKQQIQDPEEYNQAATPAHIENVQKVTEQLTLAEGFVALGQFDEARECYNRALAIDRTNTAARRGLEKVEQQVIQYHQSSRDHTRAAMLTDVDRHWATQVPRLAGDTGGIGGDDLGGGRTAGGTVREKMRSIILPQVQLIDATLEEVAQFLALQSKNYDTTEVDPSRQGVNIVLGGDAALAAKRITLSLTNVPLQFALESAANMAGTRLRTEDYLVVIGSAGGEDLSTQKFRVPPGFFSSSPLSAGGSDDPFASSGTAGEAASTGLSFARVRPEDYLKQNGITFPEGAAAFFSPVTGELTVRNTPSNLELISQLVTEASAGTPQMVKIRATMLEVNQENLEELGFDWLLGAFNVGGDGVFASGGTSGNQAGGDQQSLAQNFPLSPPGDGQLPVGSNPLTAGNRSGNAATPPNSIDGLLRGNRVADPGKKAPAITALSGVLTDPQFQVVLRGLNQRKGVDLASSPEVIAKSGQKAKVEILREFIYPTEFEPPEIPQDFGGGGVNIDIGFGGQITGISSTGGGAGGAFPVVPTTPTAFEMVQLGHSLEVEATVGADNRTIELSILPSFKEFEGFINYGTPITTVQGNERIVLTENRIPQPVFRANRVSGVNVSVWSGNTIVIAGLAGDERTTIEDKTPVLGDLPFVGRFFRTKAESLRTKAVIFLVTAEVVDPSGETPPAAAAATAGN